MRQLLTFCLVQVKTTTLADALGSMTGGAVSSASATNAAPVDPWTVPILSSHRRRRRFVSLVLKDFDHRSWFVVGRQPERVDGVMLARMASLENALKLRAYPSTGAVTTLLSYMEAWLALANGDSDAVWATLDAAGGIASSAMVPTLLFRSDVHR